MDSNKNITSAIQDFYQARNRAKMKEILSRFTGENTKLLSYDDVKKYLKFQGASERGLKDIPIKSIIGSIGRYNDFTRDFLPRKDSLRDRWANIKMASMGLTGLPPIDVYQLGDAYFVADGNHRVSVAKQLGATHLQAYVTKIHTQIPFTHEDDPDDLIIKSEYADFIENTKLKMYIPEAEIQVSLPGNYPIIEEHISVHRYFMGIDQNRPISYEDAIVDWYKTIYMPLIFSIRESGILRNFPNRTEADFYVYISKYVNELEKELGWKLHADKAIHTFGMKSENSIKKIVTQYFNSLKIFVSNLGSTIDKSMIKEKQSFDDTLYTFLFRDVLTTIGLGKDAWVALDQGIIIAKKEDANLLGLHVIPDENTEQIKVIAQALKVEYDNRCANSNITGNLAIVSGEVAQIICERAHYADLVISKLTYPPSTNPFERLESGFYEIVQKCPCPILAVPEKAENMTKGLLAYDGSPKADEAMFMAVYLTGKWDIPIVILYVNEESNPNKTNLKRAEDYFHDHGLQGVFIEKEQPVATSILETCRENSCDFIIMGGYGHSALLEVVVGSTVNQILQNTTVPVLICK